MTSQQDRQEISRYFNSIELELAEKVHSPTTVLDEVLSWTSFQRDLAKNIFEIILDESEPFIDSGQEKERVQMLVRNRLIDDWEFNEASEHLRQIQNSILNSSQSASLLRRYQQILHQRKVQSDNSSEEQELLRSGLVSVLEGRLKVSNRIYNSVFNLSWVNQNLNKNKQLNQVVIYLRRQSRLVLFVLLVLALFLAIALPQCTNFQTTGVLPSPTPNPPRTFKEVQVPKGLFRYGGSTSFAPITKLVDPAIKEAHRDFEPSYLPPITGAPGSRTGIDMLLENELAFSLSSSALKLDDVSSAKQRNFTLKAIPVAIDGIAVAVNHDLNLSNKGLTIDQVKRIYIGEITNWEQVGGPNLPITPYSRREEEGGTVGFFVKHILKKGGNFGANVEFRGTTTEALREVAGNLRGIYYASASEVVPTCTVKSLPIGRQATQLVPPYKEPFVPPFQCSEQHRNQLNKEAFKSGQYPITRQVFVIVKQNGQDDEQAGEAYANLLTTDEGQDLIDKAGFVRIR